MRTIVTAVVKFMDFFRLSAMHEGSKVQKDDTTRTLAMDFDSAAARSEGAAGGIGADAGQLICDLPKWAFKKWPHDMWKWHVIRMMMGALVVKERLWRTRTTGNVGTFPLGNYLCTELFSYGCLETLGQGFVDSSLRVSYCVQHSS